MFGLNLEYIIWQTNHTREKNYPFLFVFSLCLFQLYQRPSLFLFLCMNINGRNSFIYMDAKVWGGSIQIGTMWLKGLLLLAVSINALFESVASLNQSNFPAGFVFGTASSAYQVYFIQQSSKLFSCYFHSWSIYVKGLELDLSYLLWFSVFFPLCVHWSVYVYEVWRCCIWGWQGSKHMGQLHSWVPRLAFGTSSHLLLMFFIL